MKALIEPNGRIAQLSDTPFPVAPPFIWVDVPDDVKQRDRYENGVVVKYVPPVELPAVSIENRLDALELRLAALERKP